MMVRKKRKWTNLWLLLISCWSIGSSCTSPEQIKHEQFVIAGKNLYTLHCANCHGSEGEGLRSLYPPIAYFPRWQDTDYLTCLIRKGTAGNEINMPGNTELYALDIAQLLTFLNDKWGDGRMIDTEEVAKVQCP